MEAQEIPRGDLLFLRGRRGETRSQSAQPRGRVRSVQGSRPRPAKYSVLRWSWKIGSTIPNGDERTKAGDDYAARVYIVFPRTLFWKTKAINYIWANRLPQGESLPNAFTSNAVMVAVESGDEKTGTWVNEERNVYKDYQALFGEDPPPIGAVALMTDTDNTGGEAEALYGDIFLGPAR
jgi:hypothetical protein